MRNLARLTTDPIKLRNHEDHLLKLPIGSSVFFSLDQSVEYRQLDEFRKVGVNNMERTILCRRNKETVSISPYNLISEYELGQIVAEKMNQPEKDDGIPF